MKTLIIEISIFLVGLLICSIIDLLIAKIPRKALEPQKGKVVLPKWILVVGIISAAFFLFLAALSFIIKESISFVLFFFTISILSSSLIFAQLNCRIYYDNIGFTSKNFWGIKRRYSYRDIEYIKGKERAVKLYIGRHIVRIDEGYVGKYEFLALVEKQYRKYHNGNTIPTRDRKSPFKNIKRHSK